MTFITNPISVIDTNNSTVATLTANSTFTGTSTLTSGYNSINLTILSDVISSPLGVSVQFSDDNISWTTYNQFTYLIPSSKSSQTFTLIKKYYRIVYTNDGTNQTTFDLSSFLTPTNNSTNTTTTYPDVSIDTYGKLKIVEPLTLLDMRYFSNGITSNPLVIINSVTGAFTGTISHASLTISGSATGSYTSQSRLYTTYQPGKSMLINETGVINNGNNTSGCISRIGYFDNNDGLYFSYDGANGIAVNILNGGSATQVLRSSWNVDKMDGSGPSGFNLNFAKEQFFIIEFAWLGVGIIKFGFNIRGRFYICHSVSNYNALSFPYMNNPDLPLRYQLICNTNSDNGSMLQGCGSVISEGGYNPVGRPFSYGNQSFIIVSTSETPLLALSGNSNYYHQNIIPTSFTFLDNQTADSALLRMRLYLGGQTGPGTISWTDINTNYSVMQGATGISGFTAANSIIVYEDYAFGRTSASFNDLSNTFSNLFQIGSNVNNVSDILVITAQNIGSGNTNVVASISWQEIY